MGGEVVVHVACRERSRASLESPPSASPARASRTSWRSRATTRERATRPLARGLRHRLGRAPLHAPRPLRARPALHAGLRVNPFKALEADLVPQLLKLALKVRAGAVLAIARSVGTRARWSRAHALERGAGPGHPAHGLGLHPEPAAWPASSMRDERARHPPHATTCWPGREPAAESPDKGRGRVPRAGGQAGRGGARPGLRRCLRGRPARRRRDRHAAAPGGRARPADWRGLAGRGLLSGARRPSPLRARRRCRSWRQTDRCARRGLAGAPALLPPQPPRPRPRLRPRTRLASRPPARLYARLESLHLAKPAHVLEQVVKIPMFGCKRLRRLLAAGHRLPVPRERLRQEPAQRALRRLARRASARCPASPASGPTPTIA